jgi:predicted anti-sigma-YlaC factor YlaD
MGISCKNARTICDKSQYKECSSWERLKLEFHLLSCKSCRKYSKDNAKLTKLIQKNLDDLPRGCSNREQLIMSEESKQKIQNKIHRVLEKREE